jgi:hypothetical protein
MGLGEGDVQEVRLLAGALIAWALVSLPVGVAARTWYIKAKGGEYTVSPYCAHRLSGIGHALGVLRSRLD